MARDVSTDNVLLILSALNEANAYNGRGLSIPELSEATGLTRWVVTKIIERPDYGFVPARGRSNTGATTYYHDVTKMTATVVNDGKIQPLQFDDKEKVEFLVHNLMTALHTIDPLNELVSKFNPEDVDKDKDKSKGRGGKNWFDWYYREEDIKWLANKAREEDAWKAKVINKKIDEFLKDKGLASVLGGFVYSLPDKINRGDLDGALRQCFGIARLILEHREEILEGVTSITSTETNSE